MNFLLPEHFHRFISFLFVHFAKHNVWWFAPLFKSFVDHFSKLFGIYKHETLGTFHFVKTCFQEIKFWRIFWTFIYKLSNIIKFQFFSFNFDLLCRFNYLSLPFFGCLLCTRTVILRPSSWEKHVLNLILWVSIFDIFTV